MAYIEEEDEINDEPLIEELDEAAEEAARKRERRKQKNGLALAKEQRSARASVVAAEAVRHAFATTFSAAAAGQGLGCRGCEWCVRRHVLQEGWRERGRDRVGRG